MTLTGGSSLLTENLIFIARAKLPDDLTFDEFETLVKDIRRIELAARTSVSRYVQPPTGRVARVFPPSFEVKRVQYGSEFLVILGIVGTTAVSATAVGGAVLLFARALKVLADAGLANEQRLELRDERLKRRTKRRRAEKKAKEIERNMGRDSSESNRIAGALIADHVIRDRVLLELVRTQPAAVYAALVELSAYGVELSIEDELK